MSEQDEELRWRLELLKVQLEKGKIFIADHLAKDLEKASPRSNMGMTEKSTLTQLIVAFVHSLSLWLLWRTEKKKRSPRH
jgi:hypothetical protein